MSDYDSFRRFFFEDLGIRGEWVRLDDSWEAARAGTSYPLSVEAQLGQALAAVVLLSGTIKFQGSLILQIQSTGPLTTLVAQATHSRTIRGAACWKDPIEGDTLPEVFGEGRMVLTIQNQNNPPYQGIVALEGNTLAQAIEVYFTRSEQLPTRLWLFADHQRAGGLFIQALPEHTGTREDWNRVNFLADTLTKAELLNLPSEVLLYRLFNEERVRLFEPETVVFRCGCTRERVEQVLIALGLGDVGDLLDQDSPVRVCCEFCNRDYQFDRVDIAALFAQQSRFFSPATRH